MAELIKRVDEFYVGFKAHKPDELPLAFLTPFDGTAAFRKRKETVDSWANGYGRWVDGKYQYDTHPDAKNIKNEPLAGFSIAKSVKRTGSWNGGNVVWRIEDPRGFEWEIPSPNLAQIITQTGISAGGVINGRCIIGRLGSANILIPEGTDLWDQMNVDMAIRDKKANAKTITGYVRGQGITLKNGTTGWCLGLEHLKLRSRISGPAYASVSGNTADAYHLVVTKTTYGWYTVTAYKTLAVVAIDANDLLSAADEAQIRHGGQTSFKFAGAPPMENAYPVGIV